MLKYFHETVRTVCTVAVTIALAFPLIRYGWPVARRVEVASHQLLDCTWKDAEGRMRSNPACLQSTILAITGSIRHSSGEAAKAMPVIASSLRDASKNSIQASQEATETAKAVGVLVRNANGAISELTGTLTDLHKGVNELTQSAAVLLKSSDEVVKKVGEDLDKLGELENTLNKQLAAGDPIGKLGLTLSAMKNLLENPALENSLGNIEASTANLSSASKSGAHILETFDLATQGLREKIGRVKWLLGKLFELVKAGIPLLRGGL